MVTMMPVMMLLMNGLSLAIIWAGAHQVAQARMQVGDMMAFLQYAMQIVFAFLMLSMMFIFLPRAAVSGARIADVLETETDHQRPTATEAVQRARLAGAIEFRQVSFRYPGALDDVLHDISFTARPGQTTALIGSTGCGKSTLVNLIPRFLRRDRRRDRHGRHRHPSRHAARPARQDRLRPATRDPLFGDHREQPALCRRDAGDERWQRPPPSPRRTSSSIPTRRVWRPRSPRGVPTSRAGRNSGWPSPARWSNGRPSISLTTAFRPSISKPSRPCAGPQGKRPDDSTVLIVTQRVASVKNADQIIVLDEGRIVGQGTHHELMESCRPTARSPHRS
jgi:ATP-binding cassette, subfamily B, multidrug efflux pump